MPWLRGKNFWWIWIYLHRTRKPQFCHVGGPQWELLFRQCDTLPVVQFIQFLLLVQLYAILPLVQLYAILPLVQMMQFSLLFRWCNSPHFISIHLKVKMKYSHFYVLLIAEKKLPFLSFLSSSPTCGINKSIWIWNNHCNRNYAFWVTLEPNFVQLFSSSGQKSL